MPRCGLVIGENEMKKNLDLLRPFDLEAAKRGGPKFPSHRVPAEDTVIEVEE